MTSKDLSEMTLDELWHLFPIFLTEHRNCWKDWFEDEKKTLIALLPKRAVITHVGSTAINGIWAKPIIDILVELPSGTDLGAVRNTLVHNNYICMAESEKRISLNKGYTANGFAERVFHIHLVFENDNDEIIFRDYLNLHPDIASEYEKLKFELWKKFEYDRDGYTSAKYDFIRKCLKSAYNEK